MIPAECPLQALKISFSGLNVHYLELLVTVTIGGVNLTAETSFQVLHLQVFNIGSITIDNVNRVPHRVAPARTLFVTRKCVTPVIPVAAAFAQIVR